MTSAKILATVSKSLIESFSNHENSLKINVKSNPKSEAKEKDCQTVFTRKERHPEKGKTMMLHRN